ncbi:PaaX family transcriptional regulator, partial [Streptomyces sp. NPDC049577]
MTDQQPPHTPRSLIVTFYGAYGRGGAGTPHGPVPDGPVPIAALIRLLGAVGVDAPSVRSAVSRLKRRGLLVPGRTAHGAAGYGLSEAARQLLEDGDRRIDERPPGRPGGWLLA